MDKRRDLNKVLPRILAFGLLTILVSLGIILFSIPSKTQAAVVNLDPTFGGVGYVTWNGSGNGNDEGHSLQIQSDGKYIVTGFTRATNNDMAIWRYNSDGTLDTTFNGVGYATHNGAAGGNGDDRGYSVVIQSDGKYVVAGCSDNIAGNADLAIWRYNIDGSIDTTFNGVGYVTHNGAGGGSGNDEGRFLQIQTDGKYVVGGQSENLGAVQNSAIWRYNTDGTLDNTFNGIGYVAYDPGVGTCWIRSLRIQTDGKIVATGTIQDDFAIWRYSSAGVLDNTFNGVGFVTDTTAAGGGDSWGRALQIQSDGSFVVVGTVRTLAAVYIMSTWRYSSVGALDATFNGTGYNVNTSAGSGSSLQILSSGKYVVAGGAPSGLGIYRYNTNGSLDTSFNGTGSVATNVALAGGSGNETLSLQIQNDDKYVVAGTSQGTPNRDLAIVRYRNQYQITNLATSLDTKVGGISIKIESGNGTYGTAVIVSLEKAGIRIADIPTNMTTDRNWPSVFGDVDVVAGKSVTSDLSSAPGALGTYLLYVPKLDGNNRVRICPNAITLAQVTDDCSGGYLLSEISPNVSLATIGTQNYWKVAGMTGTGGMNSNFVSSAELPETGANMSLLLKYLSPLFVL